MQQVQIGTRVKPLGIQRLSVGEGAKCRAVLLDPNPRMKYIAYDEAYKRRVEVDQDMVIKYGLRPQATFYYLVAKLNTDLNGQVIGDQFTVEYLQLSENLNNELSDQIMEQGIPQSLSLQKVKKSANGRDFSYIKTTPSQMKIDGTLLQKVEELRNNQQFIDQCWSMIDASTSITKEQYEQLLLNQPAQQPAPAQIAAPAQQTRQLPPAQSSPMPQAPENFAQQNDFGSGDDFDNWS